MISGDRLRRFRIQNTRFWSKGMCRALGLKISHPQNLHPARGLWVSNHLSYLDIIIFSSWRAFTYVTSEETHRDPVLGRICRAGGCIFVDRENPARLRQDFQQLQETIHQGFPLFVFAEATSGDGSRVLDFKPAIYQVARQANEPIEHFVLNYTAVDCRGLHERDRERLFYFGEARFVLHLWRFCAYRRVEAEVGYLGALIPDRSAKELAKASHQRVARQFKEIPLPDHQAHARC